MPAICWGMPRPAAWSCCQYACGTWPGNMPIREKLNICGYICGFCCIACAAAAAAAACCGC